MSQQAAIDFINNDANFSGNGLKGVGSGTNYDAALNGAEHAFDTAPSTPDDNRIAYFLSDGAPSSGDAIGQTDETNWINDLAGEKITDSYAIGFGDLTTSNANALEPIAVSAGESTSTHTTAAQDNHVIVIDDSDFSSLGATLAATVPASVSGNVATGTVTSGTGGADHFGADGGRVLSITIDGTTYTWDGAHKITETGVLNGSMDANSISVHTALGGQVDFYFAGGNAHEAGDWSYTAPKDVPGNSQEVFHYVLTDNDGDTAGADLTVNIAAVNDAPVNTVPVAVSVDEDSPLAFTGTNQISIADFDGGSGVETVTLSVLHGTLNLGTTSGLTSVADNGTDHVTLSGTIADINAALNSLSYQGVQNYYGSDTLTITTNDNGNGGSGGAKSDTDQVTITVNPVDDAPTAHITASNPFHATEQVGLTLATGGQALGSIADIDAGANDNMTVTLSVGEGSLNVVAGNSGIDNISNNGTSSVTITGTVAEINHLLGGIDAGSGFAGSITYTDNTDNPSASTTLTLTVNDNSHAGSGGPLTGSDIATINIAATDDAPVAANDTGTAAEKGGVSNGTPGSDATGNVLSNDIDVDSSQLFVSAVQKDSSHHGVVGSALSGDYGTLTLNSDGSYTYVVNNNDSDVQGLNVGGTLKDTFTYTVSDGQQTDTAQITITIDGANDAAVISGTTAGTVVEAGTSGGTPSVSQTLTDTDVDNSDNSWQAVNSPTASDNGYGTFTETSGGKWTYTLDNSDPDVQALTTGEHLTDTFTVHTADGTAQQISITINGANDAPTTDLNGGSNGTGNTVTFTEQTPVHIVPSAVVSDVDSPNLASMTVTLGSHPDGSSESLSLDSNALAAAALAGLTVGAYNASTGALTITGPASQAVYQEILEGLVYNNTSDNPDTHDRTVSIVVNDGSLSSAATTATIHVNAVDDAPSDIVFTGNSGLTATTSNGHTTIGNGLTLFSLGAVDVDDTTGFSYHFGSNNSVNVTIGGSSESFSMGSNSGVTTTSSLSYSTVQTINLTTPTVTDGDGLSHSETVTLQLGLNNANDSINGSAIANDQVIYGFGGNDTLTGGSGDDWIMGGTGADAVSAGAGNDTINLANGDFGNGESIDGGSGADRIVLTNGTTVDFTTGSVVGVETLIGSSSADHVTMSATQWASFSTIDLGADSSGSDTLTVEVSGTVNISAGNTPTVTGVESGSLVGSGSSDTLTITGDQLDAILGTAGTVNFDGGTNDTLNLLSTSADLNALGNGSNSNISGLETISAALATSGVTIDMSGQSEAFTLTGSSHDDVLKGGSGNDRIIGGGGNDTLTGGGGNDAFRLSSPTGGTVEITDFSNDNQHNNLDVIEILGSAFGGLNPTNTPGSLFGSSGNDNFGSTSERFHFNTNTHELLYDSNGSAAGGTQEVLAILDNGHTLAASQVHIV
jgi:VCBS repeat-containing protein